MSADLALHDRSIAASIDKTIDEMIEQAAALYRPAGRFAHFFARGKLRRNVLLRATKELVVPA